MMRFVAACLLGLLCGNAFAGSWFGINNRAFPNTIGQCPVTVGTLTLRATAPRVTGISPFLVFYDATATTDSSLVGSTTAFQDVTYSWNFGDSGASGSPNWTYGVGTNSRNVATGGVAAHLYVTAGNDTNYTVTVTATNGVNIATCLLPTVTAYDPSGANGFPGSATICVAQSTTPVAGSGGCPAAATTQTTTSFVTALGSLANGKQVLFKCGDTFTGDNAAITATKATIGAYGACVGTQTSRPILSDSTAGNQILHIGGTTTEIGDLRITDLDLEATNGARGVWADNFPKIHYQVTLNNLIANGTSEAYGFSQGAQWGLVNSVQSNETGIGTYFSFNENNPPYSGHVVNNQDYSALLGNLINGAGAPNGQGIEVVRISTCRMCVIENNTIENANNVGAVLKLHQGNTNNSCTGNNLGSCWPCTVNATFATTTCWVGIYAEFIEISDNLFTGSSGANLVENAPQNANTDERLRYIVMERNLFSAQTGAQGGRLLQVSAVNETVRDNAFYMPGTTLLYAFYGTEIGSRAMEPVPSAVEFYNNTCYAPNSIAGQNCAGFDNAAGLTTAATNSFAKNNLFYVPSGSHTTVVDTGTGNTVAANTATTTNNPSFTNGSGTFSLMSDFKPTANYTGGVSVPVINDALGVPWSPVWDFGAVHH